jgi:hypothetical protein
LILKKQGQLKKGKKAPKGSSESPWSLYMRSFWKMAFTNPPEEGGQVVRWLNYGKDIYDAKVSKSPSWVNRKIAETVPCNPKNHPDFSRDQNIIKAF